MDINGTSIGIWGFGIMGKSCLRFMSRHVTHIGVFDQRPFTTQEEALIQQYGAHIYPTLSSFLHDHDYIIPSPGIDLRPYAQYHEKWLSEFDLFQQYFHKPIIAITGSVGKTTVTHVLSQLLRAQGKHVATGGNIGIGAFDLIDQADTSDIAVLEISSFQLEVVRSFAPDLAIWTNFYPNHLDRHGDAHGYLQAKATLLRHQRPDQQALVPWALREQLRSLFGACPFAYVAREADTSMHAELLPHEKLFYLQGQTLIMYEHGIEHHLITLPDMPDISYPENIITILAALHILGYPLERSLQLLSQQQLPEHRLEKIATIHAVDFYNDSKATIPASTLAAVDKLHARPIILFIGGVSKGVDRTPFVQELKDRVRHVYCFGKEAQQLYTLCHQFGIPASTFATLDDAFHACTSHITQGDQVLFSPGGASFDLFANYEERGKYFKQLVTDYVKTALKHD